MKMGVGIIMSQRLIKGHENNQAPACRQAGPACP